MQTDSQTETAQPGSLHPAGSTAYSVQKLCGKRWMEMLDCPNAETAIEVRNHLNATRKQKHRAVKIVTEVMP